MLLSLDLVCLFVFFLSYLRCQILRRILVRNKLRLFVNNNNQNVLLSICQSESSRRILCLKPFCFKNKNFRGELSAASSLPDACQKINDKRANQVFLFTMNINEQQYLVIESFRAVEDQTLFPHSLTENIQETLPHYRKVW